MTSTRTRRGKVRGVLEKCGTIAYYKHDNRPGIEYYDLHEKRYLTEEEVLKLLEIKHEKD